MTRQIQMKNWIFKAKTRSEDERERRAMKVVVLEYVYSRHEPIGLLMEKMLSGVGSFQEIAHQLPSPHG